MKKIMINLILLHTFISAGQTSIDRLIYANSRMDTLFVDSAIYSLIIPLWENEPEKPVILIKSREEMNKIRINAEALKEEE